MYVRPIRCLLTRLLGFQSFPTHGGRQHVVQPRASLAWKLAARLFFLSRSITSCVFLTIAFGLALRNQTSKSSEFFPGSGISDHCLVLAVAANPKSLVLDLALPLLPFARSRAWLVLSGLAMIYYVRFWLTFHFSSTPLLGTAYNGPQFFDYIVTWLEFGPWFVVLALTSIRHKT